MLLDRFISHTHSVAIYIIFFSFLANHYFQFKFCYFSRILLAFRIVKRIFRLLFYECLFVIFRNANFSFLSEKFACASVIKIAVNAVQIMSEIRKVSTYSNLSLFFLFVCLFVRPSQNFFLIYHEAEREEKNHTNFTA